MRQATVRRIAAFALVLGALGAPAAARADTPTDPNSAAPAGTVTRLADTVPNYLRDDPTDYCINFNCASDKSVAVTLFADPTNGLLFETDAGAASFALSPGGRTLGCWSTAVPLLVLDEDTYQVKAFGCGGERANGSNGGGSTNSPLVAVDSADGLLFFSGNESDQGSPAGTSSDTIRAVDEKTGRLVATWSLPTLTASGTGTGLPAQPTVDGLSWSPEQKSLVVVTGYDGSFGSVARDTGPPPGLNVGIYSIASTMSRVTAANVPVAAVPLTNAYPYRVPSCGYSMTLFSQFANANAYVNAAGDALFVPCLLQGGVDGGGGAGGVLPPGVVRVALAGNSPGSDVVASALPGNEVGDFLFDPSTSRGFAPVQTNSGTIVYVYDGTGSEPRLTGEYAMVSEPVGVSNPDFNCAAFAFDATTGRMYGLAPSGLSYFDGRRTPIAGGRTFDDLADSVQYQTDVVLPPHGPYDYTRVIVNANIPQPGEPAETLNSNVCAQQQGRGTYAGTTDHVFAVYADRTDLSTDIPADKVDERTYDGDIPSGYQVSTTYGANGTGSGVHLNWAGSYGGAANDFDNGAFVNGDFLPFGGGIRDLLAGWVSKASLTDTSGANASATAIGDGNSATGSDFAACTDASAPDGCPHPAPPDGFPAPPAPPSSSGGSTAQAWPFPDAQCPLPSSDGEKTRNSSDGYWYTTGYDNNGNAVQQQFPGSDQFANASVDCAPTSPAGGAVASATAHAFAQGAGPSMQIGEAASSSTLTPAGASGPAISYTTATAHGVRIASGAGDELDIASITQTAKASAGGRPGTATATRVVTMAGVSVTSGGKSQVICQAVCPNDSSALTQINQALPGFIHVTLPQPYSPFGDPTMSNGTQTVPGSPGGYEALIQPTLADQSTSAGLFGYNSAAGETSLLPAMRIQLTPPAAGNYQLDYLVLDLAPVEADAFAGVTVQCPEGSYAPDSALPLNCIAFPTDSGGSSGPTTTPPAPGTPPQYIPGQKGHVVVGVKGHYVPGTPATPPQFIPARVNAGAPVTGALLQPAPPPLLAGGPLQIVKRVFHGFRLLARSPAEAAKFFGLLLLLALPMLMAARRRQWTRSVESH